MVVDRELAVETEWKPWVPEVGQRVRIRLSEECPALRAAPAEKETLTRFHSRAEAGKIGRVIAEVPSIWQPRQGLAGHTVLIDFDPEAIHFQGCISFCALYFAAEELEPVTFEHCSAGDSDNRLDNRDTDAVSMTDSDAPLASPTTTPKPHRTRAQRRGARRRVRQSGQRTSASPTEHRP